MNAPQIPSASQPQGETLIRKALTTMSKAKRADVMQAAGWKDESSITQVLNNNAGIKLEQLDAILEVFGLSIVEQWYMDYLARGNAIGANCCRARLSQGTCGAA
ncbi:hypothetical protein ACOTCJ_11710 [Achromobacter xylosoxidans]|uniref:hypothetical protein n=1 Tax=Alcaligenes xylosoxydans xylosoxydans TaxID=85698 RepID=UPI0003322110|nr:hypothetical protein [Achromobacter xylosoxidans]MCH4572232.1 hypothetical protein [Achromobacter xylosoxidans]OMG81430.1 hypothetical protein BIZ53_29595 [Achromobacter xylosoxidans]CCH04036.1 hypothetical protein NH44784_000441 [Achromobacter xylosoxidans NH44784-1996]